DPEVGPGLDSFWRLPLYARALFELPVASLLKRLQALYEVEEPDELVVLTVSGDELARRLKQKRGAGTERELHEQKATLEQLQKGLKASLVPLTEAFPGVRVHELDTGSLSIVQACDQ